MEEALNLSSDRLLDDDDDDVRSENCVKVSNYSHQIFCMQDVSETLGQNSVANLANQKRLGGKKIPINMSAKAGLQS